MTNPIDAYPVRFPLGGYLPELAVSKTVREPARDLPVLAECDVAVFGGGSTGVCAAVAAARAGKRVLLVERWANLGGMATTAWVNIFHTLYGTDWKTKVIGGLTEEFIRRLQAMNAVLNHSPDGETGDWRICSEHAKFVFDDMAIGSGVQLLLHARVVGALRDGRRVTAAVVETKSGRGAVLANTYIDCTGDADLIRLSGVETTLGDGHGRCQAPSLVFRLQNRAEDAAGPPEIQRALFQQPMDYNGGVYSCFTWGNPSVWDRRQQMLAGTRVLNVNAADALDLTRAEVEARYQLRWVLGRIRELRGWSEAYLTDIGAQLGIRETHRILAEHTVTREEVLHGTPFPDAIAQGTYRVDIHSPDSPGILFEQLDGRSQYVDGLAESKWSRWDGQPLDAPRRDTLCYSVPYRALIPRALDNVLAAGRCIGADHAAMGGLRVMVNCMQFGQAAGTAAAMLAAGQDVREVDPAPLRARLQEAGMPLRERT